MISENCHVLTPAYNRHYDSPDKLKDDFLKGKDFFLELKDERGLCSIRDFAPGTVVILLDARMHNANLITTCDVP